MSPVGPERWRWLLLSDRIGVSWIYGYYVLSAVLCLQTGFTHYILIVSLSAYLTLVMGNHCFLTMTDKICFCFYVCVFLFCCCIVFVCLFCFALLGLFIFYFFFALMIIVFFCCFLCVLFCCFMLCFAFVLACFVVFFSFFFRWTCLLIYNIKWGRTSQDWLVVSQNSYIFKF